MLSKENKTIHITGDFSINLLNRNDPIVLKLTNATFGLFSSYCHAVWGGCSENMLKPLLTSQKKVISYIKS